jgi:hypothetical protein
MRAKESAPVCVRFLERHRNPMLGQYSLRVCCIGRAFQERRARPACSCNPSPGLRRPASSTPLSRPRSRPTCLRSRVMSYFAATKGDLSAFLGSGSTPWWSFAVQRGRAAVHHCGPDRRCCTANAGMNRVHSRRGYAGCNRCWVSSGRRACCSYQT